MTGLFTFPLILNLTSGLPGQLLEDRDQNLWNLWWVKESILHLRNPFHTDYIYYPDGVSLYFHTLNPLNGLISLPIQLIFGTLSAYNFIVFFSFIMAGLGSYLLLLYLSNHPPAAFCASLIFVFAPYHMGTLKGLLQLISLEWLPFYILFLLRATRHPSSKPCKYRWADIAAASLCLVFITLTDWYYTMFLIGFTMVYLTWEIVVAMFGKARENRRTIDFARNDPLETAQSSSPFPTLNFGSFGRSGMSARRIGWDVLLPAGLIGVFFLLAVSPVLLAMLREMSTTKYYLPDLNDTRKYSADLLAMFLPSGNSSTWGWLGRSFLTAPNLDGPLVAQVFLGYLPLGFSVLGLITTRRTWFWGVCGLVFTILALGPALRINGPQPGWWMPYALIENLPIIQIMRSPDRFIVITMLCLAVCACFGLRWLLQRLYQFLSHPGSATKRLNQFKHSLVSAGLAVVLITELLQIPYPVNPYRVSPFFEQLGQDQADYSLLELPAQAGYWSGADRMAEQTIHHKRIFDGYISREYDHPFQRNTPGFRELTALNFSQDIVLPRQDNPKKPVALADWYDALSYYKVRYIILRQPKTVKQSASVNLNDYRAAISLIAPGLPVYKDDQLEAYSVPQKTIHQPFIELSGDKWYDPEPSARPTGDYHRWSPGQGTINLVWEGPGIIIGEFGLNLGVLEGGKSAQILYDGAVVWSDILTTGSQAIILPLKVTPGKHQILIDVLGKAKRPVSLGMGRDTRALLFYASDVSFQSSYSGSKLGHE